MQVTDEDAAALKEWLVTRLSDISDADSDVLADYVLALLANAENDADVQQLLKDEITAFLKKDHSIFANDLIQTLKHRGYLPNAPSLPNAQTPAAAPTLFNAPVPVQQGYYPNGPVAAGRKRGFQEHDNTDALDGLDPFNGGERAPKQARRGGGRRGYVDPDRPQPSQESQFGYNPRAPGMNADAPPFTPVGPHGDAPNFDMNEAFRKMQKMQEQIEMTMAFNNYSQQQGFLPQFQPQQKRRGRCRDYDSKGYCARGHNCLYEHSNEPEGMFNNLPVPMRSGQIQLPPGGQSLLGFNRPSEHNHSFESMRLLNGEGTANGLPKQFGAGGQISPQTPTTPLKFPSGSLAFRERPGRANEAFEGAQANPGPAFNNNGSGSEVAASGFSSSPLAGGGPYMGFYRPELGLLGPQADAGVHGSANANEDCAINTFDAAASVSFFPSVFGSGNPFLTQSTETQPGMANLMSLPNPNMMFPGLSSEGHDDRSNYSRDNRHGQQRRPKHAAPTRAPFSHVGPMRDKTRTKIVVENIPEERFEEKHVREFFGQFGNVLEVTMMPYKRLAIVKYDTWQSALNAHKSPKVIFDNRFVKVFWYRDENQIEQINDMSANEVKVEPSERNGFHASIGYHASEDGEDPPIDMEEFKRQQDEAQKVHEEKMRAKKELADKREELEKKVKELKIKQDAEQKKLLAKLALKDGSKSGSQDTPLRDVNIEPSKTLTQSEILRATLAKLQEEAKSLGLDPNAHLEEDATISTDYDHTSYPHYSSYHSRGRGGYFSRGRGSYPPRGSYRGRGGASGARGNIHAAFAAFSLDNRPKKVALSGIDFTNPAKDEVLRQHLFSLGEGAAEIQVTPAKTIVSFAERKAAEKFFETVRDAFVGDKVESSWVANTAGPLAGATATTIKANGSGANGGSRATTAGPDEGQDTAMADAAEANANATGNGNGTGNGKQHNSPPTNLEGYEADYDVAGDNEWDIS